jgi:hypothetical protein
MRVFLLIALFICLPAHAASFGPYVAGEKSAWDSANHPAILVKDPETVFSSLPLSGNLSDQHTLWSDSFWPRNEGGISKRWQDLSGNTRYNILTGREARNLPSNEIAKLSPAEKFDLLHEDYGFSFTRKVKKQNPLNRPDWEGICHGWTQASLHHEQFSPVTLKTKSGKEIPFASSDVAALMSYYYARVGGGRVHFLGRRCRENAGNTSIKCTDMNAGAFHVVITNLIRDKKSFILDLDPYKHVWNYPVLGYESIVSDERKPSPGSAVGTKKEILLQTDLLFVQETGPQWEPPVRAIGKKVYSYWLELSEEGKILGGSWADTDHPDFAWTSDPVKVQSPFSIFVSHP